LSPRQAGGSVFYNFGGPSRKQARGHATVGVPGATTQSTGLPDNNKMGGAWIMNAGTSTAHIMIPGHSPRRTRASSPTACARSQRVLLDGKTVYGLSDPSDAGDVRGVEGDRHRHLRREGRDDSGDVD
jgi:hypothetical protein